MCVRGCLSWNEMTRTRNVHVEVERKHTHTHAKTDVNTRSAMISLFVHRIYRMCKTSLHLFSASRCCVRLFLILVWHAEHTHTHSHSANYICTGVYLPRCASLDRRGRCVTVCVCAICIIVAALCLGTLRWHLATCYPRASHPPACMLALSLHHIRLVDVVQSAKYMYAPCVSVYVIVLVQYNIFSIFSQSVSVS